MATLWQHVGAFVQNVGNLGVDRLNAFAQAGGQWIVPVLYNDGTAVDNLGRLPGLKTLCNARGLQVGGWFNGAGGDPTQDAANIADIQHSHDLALVVLDLEAPYKYLSGNADLMPQLLQAIRVAGYSGPLAVSSYGFADRGMIWRDFWRLGVRYLPQAYWPYDPKYSPDWCLADLQANGSTDPNLADPKQKYGRGVPLSYVHPTFECTGVEQGDLAEGLRRLKLAKTYGFTLGYSLYLLERCTDTDLALVRANVGTLSA